MNQTPSILPIGGGCSSPSSSPSCGHYSICDFVSEYEDWAFFAECMMTTPIPASLILAQWGIESGWGEGDICNCHNPANQGSSCGVGSTCSVSGYKELCFCSLLDGVTSYANLMDNGYPFVSCTYWYYANQGNYNEGVKQAAIALGQGYSNVASCNTYIDYCGWSGTPSPSRPRTWAQLLYDDGNGPGSALYNTIQANSCLSSLNSR